MALLGTSAATTQTSSSILDEVVVAKLDAYVPLATQGIEATGVVLTNSAGTTTYVEGTDYTLNRHLGLLKALSTGTIADAASLKIDYTKTAFNGYKVVGGAQPTVRGKIVLDGKNLATGQPIIATIFDATFSPTNGVDFLAADFTAIDLAGSARTPVGAAGPYTVEVRSA